MKKTTLSQLILGATAAFAVGSAQAANGYDWTGFYAGGYIGATAFETETNDYWCFFACDAPGDSEIEFAIGAQGGYNWQVGENFVLGIHADIGTGASSSETISYGFDDGVEWESEWNWLLTIRGRAGLNVNRTMLFVTGGLAIADADFSAIEIDEGLKDDYNAKASETLTGLVAGVGIEHTLTDTLRLTAEVLSIVMPKEDACWRRFGNIDNACVTNEGANDDHVHWKTSGTSIRVGLNWLF
jgi:outer membrane immunogenic protein